MSANTSGASTAPNGDTKHRSTERTEGSSGRAYTVEQKTAVIRVRRCKVTAFYDILGLEEVKTTCTDTEIKKAYKKLSLLTHPDKNGYDGADEAFKMVSRAFQVLSDPDKKSKFDRFGEDPDNRFAGGSSASASPFSGFARSQGGAGGGATWEDEISPEEMFRQFFGGGIGRGGYGSPFGGGIFDTGPGFVFNVGGGPGVRIHQFGGANPRRRPRNADGTMPQPSVRSALSNLLPLLVLFLLPLLSSLFSGTGSNTPSGPSFRFDTPAPPYTMHRTTNSLKVNYYVNPVEVDRLSNRDLLNLDKRAEVSLLNKLKNECEDEVDRRRRMVQDAQGWFSNDREKMQQAMGMEMKSCKRLEGFGYTVTNRY